MDTALAGAFPGIFCKSFFRNKKAQIWQKENYFKDYLSAGNV